MTFVPTRGIYYPRGFQAVDPSSRLQEVMEKDPPPSISLISRMETWFYFRDLTQAEATVAFHPVIFQARWWNPGWYVTHTERQHGQRWTILDQGDWNDALTGPFKAMVEDCYRIQDFCSDNDIPNIPSADIEVLCDQIHRDNTN